MKGTEYRRLVAAEMKKRRWRTAVKLSSRLCDLPVGTEVKVVGKFNGLTVETEPCPHCNVTVRFIRVNPAHVEEIPEG